MTNTFCSYVTTQVIVAVVQKELYLFLVKYKSCIGIALDDINKTHTYTHTHKAIPAQTVLQQANPHAQCSPNIDPSGNIVDVLPPPGNSPSRDGGHNKRPLLHANSALSNLSSFLPHHPLSSMLMHSPLSNVSHGKNGYRFPMSLNSG